MFRDDDLGRNVLVGFFAITTDCDASSDLETSVGRVRVRRLVHDVKRGKL